jgi:chaperonin GroES
MIQPTQDFVLLELVQGTTFTKGGLVIPENAKSRVPKGVVRATGPGTAINSATGLTTVPVSLVAGEIVIFNPNGSYNVEDHDGVKCVLLRERDVIAIDGVESSGTLETIQQADGSD